MNNLWRGREYSQHQMYDQKCGFSLLSVTVIFAHMKGNSSLSCPSFLPVLWSRQSPLHIPSVEGYVPCPVVWEGRRAVQTCWVSWDPGLIVRRWTGWPAEILPLALQWRNHRMTVQLKAACTSLQSYFLREDKDKRHFQKTNILLVILIWCLTVDF